MRNLYEKRLIRVLEYIFDNPAGDLSLDKLADVAAMSRFHWHRVFHAMMGETCADAVRRIRLHRAALWLVQSKMPIAQIAMDCGYGSVQSFSRAFREDYKITPGQFRIRGSVEAELIKHQKGTQTMYDVTLSTEPARRLIGLPHTGPYTEIGKAFESLTTIINGRNRWPDIKALIGVYYDDPSLVAPQDLRSFAGVEIGTNTPGEEGLSEKVLDGGLHAVLNFRGPYSGLANAYTYLYGEWLAQSGRDIADHPCFEAYLNSPADTAPEDLITKIYVPLK